MLIGWVRFAIRNPPTDLGHRAHREALLRAIPPRRRVVPAAVLAVLILSILAPPVPVGAQVVACPPFSHLSCDDVAVSLPTVLTFDGSEGGLPDANGTGTGFTMVQPKSSAGDPYVPGNLLVQGGDLRITTTSGLQYRVPGNAGGAPVNSLDNGLGVGISPGTRPIKLETTLEAPPAGTGKAQQAGLWFGPDEDNYVKFVILSANATRVRTQLMVEEGGGSAGDPAQAPPELNSTAFVPGASTIRLTLILDPVAGTATATYRVGAGSEQTLPGAGSLPFSPSLFSDADIASALPDATTTAGIFASHRNGPAPLEYRFGSFSIETLTDASSPAAPSGFTASGGNGRVSLDWTNNTEFDLAGYNVYRSESTPVPLTDPPLNGTTLLTASTFDDTSVVNGTTYHYVVTAVDDSGNESAPSVERSATPNDGDDQEPSSPTGLTATPGDARVSLDWDDNGETDLAGYHVYRDTSFPVSLSSPVNASPIPTSQFTDTGVQNGQTYYYVVTAVDSSANESLESETVNATPSLPVGSILVNFQSPSAPVPAGYVRDFGQPYGPRTLANQGSGLSYGWVVPGTNTPRDLSLGGAAPGNGRDRNLVADQRYDTLMHMQADDIAGSFGGTKLPGSWEIAIPNGTYTVTAAAGDPAVGADPESHQLNIEGVTAIDRFVPSGSKGAATRSTTATITVRVQDGRLTVDALGGSNTKIHFIDIVPDSVGATRPAVTGVTPANGDTGVSRDVGIAATVSLPNVGQGVDPTTMTGATVRLERASTGTPVTAHLNTSGGGDVIVLQPVTALDANTRYTFRVTSGLRDTSGASFLPFQSHFITGTQGGGGGGGAFDFEKVPLPTADGRPFTSVEIGPDGQLYAGTITGEIARFPINADGTLGTPQIITSLQAANGGNDRMLMGMAFDPASTPTNPILWVTHSAFAFTNGPDWTGKLSRLSGPNLATVQDYVVGLPRSIRDHLTNSVRFGPDGALYFLQGSNTAMGAPDSAWGNRPEHLLNAALLRFDPAAVASPPLNAKTSDGGTYDPFAPGAALTIYASGIRNAFDLLWHTNGKLYVPTNGSAAGGNTPGTPTPLPSVCAKRLDSASNGVYTGPEVPGITNVTTTQNDYLFRVQQGGYYGHPDPARCEWVMNGGNPTSSPDPGQVGQYPVGTQPDRNWRGFAFDFGRNKSPNGVIEYRSNAFGGALQGKLLVVRYSQGDDIIVLTPGSGAGDIVDAQVGATGLTGFADPLDLIEDPSNGRLYVTELGENRITLLRPLEQGSGEGDVDLTPARLVFNDVQGGAASATQTVTIQNQGTAALNVSGINIIGPDASQFQTTNPPALPATIPVGGSLAVQVAFAPTSVGPKAASLQVTSDDPDEGQALMRLRGLGTAGIGGANEPSLQWILDTYEIPVDVGDTDPTNSSLPTSPLLGDEVPIQRFVKAGSGPVVVKPLAVFGPDGANPVVRFGWYPSGNGSAKNELFSVSNSPASNAQTLNVPASGTLQFDPGTQTFSIYSIWPFFSNREVFGEDVLNTFSGAIPHHVRVYPLRDPGGQLVPNAYVVATEEHTSGFDYQDVVVELHNVQAAPTSGGESEISVGNLDGVPYDDRLVFSRIGSLTSPPANGVHDQATVRISSDGSDPLSVSELNVTGPWQIVPPPSLPQVVAPGGHVDVTLRFVATTGDLHTGSLAIGSNDADEPTTIVQLAGFWQSVSEGGQEPRLVELMQVFGFSTQINRAGQPLNQQGLVTAVGDEVLSPYWRRADTTLPVTVRQLSAFHTQGATAALRWHAKGSTSLSAIFTSAGVDGQTVLPRRNGDLSVPAAGSFTPSANVFGFKVDGEWSDPTKNNQTVDQSNGCPGPCGHHVRFWPVRDRAGRLVPDTWLLSMDYSGINYDYNDNTYLISNIKPELPVNDPAAQALLPGSDRLVLPFDGTRPNTLPDKDGEWTGFTSTQPNENDVTAGSNSFQPGLLDINVAPPGTLTVTSTAGTNAGGDNTQTNGLQLAYDASLAPSTVHARLIGPFTQFNSGQRQGGVMFGTNQDNYVKLVATNKNGTPSIELFSEVSGAGSSGTTVAIPTPSTLQTLDLYLIPDPAQRRVRAAYAATGPGVDTGIVQLPGNVLIPSAQEGRFFARSGRAGILTSHKASTQITVTFDRFSITPGDVTSPDTREALHRFDVAGAGTYTDTHGNAWIPDTGLFTPSSAINEGATVQPQEIANTDDDVIYRTYRGNVGNVPLSQRILTYEIPTSGVTDLDLRLHFAERSNGNDQPGERLFDVIAEGRTVLRQFDIVAAAGGLHTAIVAPINDVSVRDGSLTLTFRTVADYASIAGIEVLCPGTCPPPDTSPPPAPTGLTATVTGADVELDWANASGSDIGGYNVYRSATQTGPYMKLNTGLITVSRFTDLGLADGTWFYRVTTVDTAGNESAQSQTQATIGTAPDSFTTVTWTTGTQNPLARHEAFGAVVDGKLYLFGGYFGDPQFTPTTRADAYDPVANTWTQIADLPRGLSHAGATAVGTNIYFAGGYPAQLDGTGQNFSSTEVWKYDTLTNTYSPMPALPGGRGGGALVAVDGFLHFFGGSNPSRVDATTNHWRLALSGGTQWQARAPMPVPRNHLGGVALNGKIYAVGGQSGQDQTATYRADVHMYDPVTNTWTAVASLPLGISHNNASTITMGGRIIVIGGERGYGQPIADVRAYTPSSNTWVDLTPLPTNRAAGVAAAIDGTLIHATGNTARITYEGVPGT
jgi:fibronectin type 3 domain-containing protein